MKNNQIEDINTKHHFNSGVYAREMHIPKGYVVEGHKHKFDHMSILASGKVRVIVDQKETTHIAPCVLNIKAGQVHQILALQDSDWFCVHASDETEMSTLESILIEEA